MIKFGGDFDYDTLGAGYGAHRQADPRISAILHQALGDARTVLNVGAGAGSYEPADRYVLAIEPSAGMRAQRSTDAAPAVIGFAEQLPLDDASVDAAMATMTVHQWSDAALGLKELRRVSRGPVVILAADGDTLPRYWLNDYAPEVIAAEQRRYPAIAWIAAALGARSEVIEVPIPIDCTDGLTEAFYARPERLLDPAVRRAQSSWRFVGPEVEPRFERTLGADLASGLWDERYGHLRTQPTFKGSLRVIVGYPDAD